MLRQESIIRLLSISLCIIALLNKTYKNFFTYFFRQKSRVGFCSFGIAKTNGASRFWIKNEGRCFCFMVFLRSVWLKSLP